MAERVVIRVGIPVRDIPLDDLDDRTRAIRGAIEVLQNARVFEDDPEATRVALRTAISLAEHQLRRARAAL